MDSGIFFKLYDQSLACYKCKEYDTAWQLMAGYEQITGRQVLQGSLLKAYILREQKKYVSEISLLKALVEDFSASEDKKRLADAYSLLGSAYRMLGRSEEAVAAFEESARLEPSELGKLTEISNALFAANAIEDLQAGKMQELYERYRQSLKKIVVEPYPSPTWHNEKIRVGYLSADLRNHAVGQFVRPLLFDFDRDAFEVYVYQLNEVSDFVTEELRCAPVHWQDMSGQDLADLAEAVRRDEIDILFELGGHTANSALPVFAWRSARTQISGIGYFNSTGLDECDGFLSDIYCAPEVSSPYFTEKLLRLPHTHFCYQPYKEFPEVSPSPCLKNGYITFGSFNNFAKVNDGMLCLWREILARVPDSRLLLKHQLLGTTEGREFTLQRLRKLQLPLERIVMRDYSEDYLLEYGDMDIALDTLPYPGGVTTFEAMYMGVPVVTLSGNRHGARFGASILSNLNLGELVAADTDKYVDIAVALAGDRELLLALRHNLRRMMQASTLMDGKRYMKDLESLYRQLMLERTAPSCS